MAVLDIIKQKTHRTENYKCYKQNDVSCQQLYLVFLLLLVYGNPLVFEFFPRQIKFCVPEAIVFLQLSGKIRHHSEIFVCLAVIPFHRIYHRKILIIVTKKFFGFDTVYVNFCLSKRSFCIIRSSGIIKLFSLIVEIFAKSPVVAEMFIDCYRLFNHSEFLIGVSGIQTHAVEILCDTFKILELSVYFKCPAEEMLCNHIFMKIEQHDSALIVTVCHKCRIPRCPEHGSGTVIEFRGFLIITQFAENSPL